MGLARKRETTPDPIESAREAGLRYVSDATPGWRRIATGVRRVLIGGKRGTRPIFRYADTHGKVIRAKEVIRRIERLAIPPAWTDVWICPVENGHIQATGRDARGRKQYRYHPRWREVRDETKYGRMAAFATALPKIRAKVDHDLSLSGLPRDKVLATVVRLLEKTHVRVGNEEYARKNQSFGLTTLKDEHVDVTGATIVFQFRGKSGKEHRVDVRDERAARVVARCSDLPGEELFQYVGDDGETRSVGSADVNAYLREASDADFTAKDFRTWAGTVLAARALCAIAALEARPTQKQIVLAVKAVSTRLGNTPAVCRRCYVHPGIFEAHLAGGLARAMARRSRRDLTLSREEAAVLALLTRRGARSGSSSPPRPSSRLRSGRRAA